MEAAVREAQEGEKDMTTERFNAANAFLARHFPGQGHFAIDGRGRLCWADERGHLVPVSSVSNRKLAPLALVLYRWVRGEAMQSDAFEGYGLSERAKRDARAAFVAQEIPSGRIPGLSNPKEAA